jgi:hypothetical protein
MDEVDERQGKSQFPLALLRRELFELAAPDNASLGPPEFTRTYIGELRSWITELDEELQRKDSSADNDE